MESPRWMPRRAQTSGHLQPHSSLQEEQQRPDPFLERFQGPELQTVPADASSDPEDEEAEEKTKK